MKYIHIFFGLIVTVGCGGSNSSTSTNNPSSTPSGSSRSPEEILAIAQERIDDVMVYPEKATPSGSLRSPEEILAIAQERVDDVMVYPEKAKTWHMTSQAVLESGTKGTGFLWYRAAKEAVSCAYYLAQNCSSDTLLNDIPDFLDIVANCVINCAQAHWCFSPLGCEEKRSINGRSPEDYLKFIMNGLQAPTSRFDSVNLFHTDVVTEQIYMWLPHLKILFNYSMDHMKEGCKPFASLGVQKIIEEAESICNATQFPERGTSQDKERVVQNLTRMSLLLVEAVKAMMPAS